MDLIVIFLSLAVLAASKINFDVECNYYGDVCPKVKDGFALAAKFLENALKLTNPINIKADYSDYTNDPEWDEVTTGTHHSK
ncbi:hypothetical protein DSO57_1028311 [Entomophthora muscae]|uniref:Uncharacterized protein n=1 Tax=Entomophthora muscae TaxID=34485 RepID=A0ACC2T1R9_9FUNG|nr:hypothetical protein DSO57_1028311 [Entomophthora muscae]